MVEAERCSMRAMCRAEHCWLVINMIDQRVHKLTPEFMTYTIAKMGLWALTRTAAQALAPQIRVNAIGPGPIATALFERANPPEAPATQRILGTVPVRRLGRPEEVAHHVASLLDARAGFTTGQVLYVCGGASVGSLNSLRSASIFSTFSAWGIAGCKPVWRSVPSGAMMAMWGMPVMP